jgi:hypothetical protein
MAAASRRRGMLVSLGMAHLADRCCPKCDGTGWAFHGPEHTPCSCIDGKAVTDSVIADAVGFLADDLVDRVGYLAALVDDEDVRVTRLLERAREALVTVANAVAVSPPRVSG